MRKVAIALICVLPALLPAQGTESSAIPAMQSDADAQWNEITQFLQSAPEENGNTQGHRSKREHRLRSYRERGLVLFRQFEEDARRWEWLLTTLQNPPDYWRDPEQVDRLAEEGKELPVDEASVKRWEQIVRAELRPAFFASDQVTSAQRAYWYQIKLNQMQGKLAVATWEDVSAYLFALLAYAAEPKVLQDNEDLAWRVSILRLLNERVHLGVNEQRVVINALKSSQSKSVLSYADGMDYMVKLRDNPLELQLTTVQGEHFDVRDWRGKVVLVDFWSTGCSSCIESMPHIKQVYERYHGEGFEVISICVDDANNKPIMEKILKKVGELWPAAWLEVSENQNLVQRFVLAGFPRYLLLDQEGKLVTSDIGNVRKDDVLASLVRRLLVPPLP